MNFCERLNLLFPKLGFTNAKVARLGGIDPSIVSRLRTGDRMPSAGSKQVKLLCRGLVMLAEEKGKTDALCAFCELSHSEPKRLCGELEHWLSQDGAGMRAARRERKADGEPEMLQKELHAFSDKLNALMEVFELTNIRLAHTLHIDASLISRFRTGMRAPVGGGWFPERFCAWLAERIIAFPSRIGRERLNLLVGEPVPEDVGALQSRILEWICTEPEPGDSQLLSHFLAGLDDYRPPSGMQPGIAEPIQTDPARIKGSEIFHGMSGLREAVRRFLSVAGAHSERTLYLYSDQPMDWLTGDPGYARTWAALMSVVLRRKNKIRIIHNIDRSLPERLEALEKWVPPYMTGLIEPFYCEKKHDSRFYQTRFVLPGICSVEATFVAGTEDSAEYLLTAKRTRVDYNCRQFEALLRESKPLLRIFTLHSLSDYADCMSAAPVCRGPSVHLMGTLSVATMPEELLERILERGGLSDEQKNFAREFRANDIARFDTERGDVVTELVALPHDEDIFAGRVKIGLPAMELYYTDEEFAAHVKNIIRLLEAQKSYRLYPLPETPFENVTISVWHEKQSVVMKTDAPAVAFFFENPMMNRAFSKYLGSLAQKVMPGAYQRDTVISRLINYIT